MHRPNAQSILPRSVHAQSLEAGSPLSAPAHHRSISSGSAPAVTNLARSSALTYETSQKGPPSGYLGAKNSSGGRIPQCASHLAVLRCADASSRCGSASTLRIVVRVHSSVVRRAVAIALRAYAASAIASALPPPSPIGTNAQAARSGTLLSTRVMRYAATVPA